MLTGKLGDVVYQITRDARGEFVQSAYNYVPDPRNPQTDNQICARASMACIERAMFTYYDLIYNAFQGCEAGVQSINEFSRLNYQMVRNIFDTFYDVPEIEDPYFDFPKKGQKSARGGVFTMCNGSLPSPTYFSERYSIANNPLFSIHDSQNVRNERLGDWLDRHSLKRGDVVDFFFFDEGTSDSYNFLGRFQLGALDNANLSTIITSSNFRSLLNVKSNCGANIVYYNDIGNFVIEWQGSAADHNSYVSCFGTKLSRFDKGFWKFNRGFMHATLALMREVVKWQDPYKVFSTWKD